MIGDLCPPGQPQSNRCTVPGKPGKNPRWRSIRSGISWCGKPGWMGRKSSRPYGEAAVNSQPPGEWRAASIAVKFISNRPSLATSRRVPSRSRLCENPRNLGPSGTAPHQVLRIAPLASSSRHFDSISPSVLRWSLHPISPRASFHTVWTQSRRLVLMDEGPQSCLKRMSSPALWCWEQAAVGIDRPRPPNPRLLPPVDRSPAERSPPPTGPYAAGAPAA